MHSACIKDHSVSDPDHGSEINGPPRSGADFFVSRPERIQKKLQYNKKGKKKSLTIYYCTCLTIDTDAFPEGSEINRPLESGSGYVIQINSNPGGY